VGVPDVTLYGRVGCHLCDEGRAVVARVCAELGVPWREVDVDDPPAPGAPDLLATHGDLVPVVEIDGDEVARWRVDEGRLRRVLLARIGPG
jgi:hypothetical protein